MSLPPKGKIRPTKHHAELPWKEVPAFVAELRKRDAISARAPIDMPARKIG